MSDYEIEVACEEAYIAACELCSPNSIEFEYVLEQQCELRGV